VNVYETKLLSPEMKQVSDALVHVYPPGEEVAVYDVIVAPPVEDGAFHATVAVFAPAVAVTFVGAPGTRTGDVTLIVQASSIDPRLQVHSESLQYPATLTKYVKPFEIV
jgi:hypothetical protein